MGLSEITPLNKTCRVCEVVHTIDNFYVSKHHKDGKMSMCKFCSTKKRAAYAAKERKERSAKWNLNKAIDRYATMLKLSKEDVAKFIDNEVNAHGTKCKLCGTVCTLYSGGKSDKKHAQLCLDHCHTTNKLRGLICRRCNATLGMVKDNPAILHNMINYLMEA